MSFGNWIRSLFKRKPSAVEVSENQSIVETISELHMLIEKQQEIIKEQKKHSEVMYIPDNHQEEIIESLKKEIIKYQEILRTYEETANKLNVQLEDVRLMYHEERVKAQELATRLDKEQENVLNLERELNKGKLIPDELREEIEKKNCLIREFEMSTKTLKNNFEEISNRYHEASEKYETEKQNAIRLEMLILDLDKELGLMDIAEKISPKEEETIGIMIKNSR